MNKEHLIKEQIETVEKERQVPHQLRLLTADLDELETATAILRDNLSHVLEDDLLSTKDKDTEKNHDLVPLAAQIRQIDRRLRIMLSTVRYFSEACQL